MFQDVQTGDTVTRMLTGTIPMELQVTDVTEGLVTCGPWTFCRKTGAEVDKELGWGPPPQTTGSFLRRKPK